MYIVNILKLTYKIYRASVKFKKFCPLTPWPYCIYKHLTKEKKKKTMVKSEKSGGIILLFTLLKDNSS